MTIEIFGVPPPAGLIHIDGLSSFFDPSPFADATTPRSFPPPQGLGLAMVARPFNPDAAVTLTGWGVPAGLIPIDGDVEFRGGSTVVVASTHGYTSQGADDPAHTHFPSVLAEGFNYEITLFSGIDPAVGQGGAGGGRGNLMLTDPAGILDTEAVSYSWDSRPVNIYRGSNTAAFSAWTRVATMTSAGLTTGSTDKRIALRDLQFGYYACELLDRRYAGTGGAEGDASMQGRPKPQSYGQVFGVEPTLLDATNRVYQWHDRAVRSVDLVREGASSYTLDADYPTLAALNGASLTVGRYATCNALGLLRLGSTPVYGIRINGHGDAEGGYVETRGAIARRIATTRGFARASDPSGLDTLSFARLDALQSSPCGWHFNSDIKIGQALDTIMSGCAGYWWVGLDGLLAVAQLEAPAIGPDVVLTLRPDVVGYPEMQTWTPPRWRTSVGYMRMASPQGVFDLGSTTETQQRLYGQEWRWITSEQSSTRTKFPTATDVQIAAGYATQHGAEIDAPRQQTLFGVRRETWLVPVVLDPFAPVIGQTVRIDGYTRHGWGGSRSFRCIGIRSVAGLGHVSLLLWG